MKHLLLLHGALASAAQFDSFTPLLQSQFKTGTLNFSGHGKTSAHAQGFTFSVFAEDILRHIDSNQIERINLFGYSMGGYAALAFARLYPDRVEKISTLNVKFKWDKESTQKEVNRLHPETILAKVPTFAHQLIALHGEQEWKTVLSHTGDMMLSLANNPFLRNEDIWALNIPILLGIGDRDTTSSVEETIENYRKMAQSQLLVLPNTPHPFEKVNKEVLAQVIHTFFSS